MKIYTRKGDDGTTSLSGGKRIPKHHVRIESYGTVDELISWTGLIRSHPECAEKREILVYIQDQLMRAAAALARDLENPKSPDILPDKECIGMLEREIDEMEKSLDPLSSFILPGGSIPVSHCHIARCVCRRGERAALRLKETEFVPDIVITLLNRLSDYYFVLSRYISKNTDNEEVAWII